jgi:hypothetical protein
VWNRKGIPAARRTSAIGKAVRFEAIVKNHHIDLGAADQAESTRYSIGRAYSTSTSPRDRIDLPTQVPARSLSSRVRHGLTRIIENLQTFIADVEKRLAELAAA